MRNKRYVLLTMFLISSFLLSAFITEVDQVSTTQTHYFEETFADPLINIWYGDNQVFGSQGTPQDWINILGNVQLPDPESSGYSLTYRLNEGAPKELNIGSDNRRLYNNGDFNIDLDLGIYDREWEETVSDVVAGWNTVEIQLREDSLLLETQNVNFYYDNSTTWELPYTIDWDSVSDAQEVVQFVDGKWSWNSDGIHIDEVGYDRLVNIGDLIWQDLVITVPVTIHSIDSTGFSRWESGYSASVGVIVHWTGHTYTSPGYPALCDQPYCYWEPSGASAIHVWEGTTEGIITDRYLQLNADGTSESSITQFNENRTYWLKVKVEKEGTGYRYFMKSWESGYSEPSSWALQRLTTSENQYFGSVLLVAHHVDATFGDVIIEPVGGELTLNTSVTGGSGSILKDPDKTFYQYAEKVTLTADPAPGYAFVSWGGALSGSANPQELTMTGNTSVTATFEPSSTYTLTVNESPNGSGTVMVDPQKASYNAGEEVTLTAVPASGWSFGSWSGSISGSTNPMTITMDSDKTITANFVENSYTLTTESNPSAGGSIEISPLKSTYTAGEQVTLRAIPTGGWQFLNWSGDDNRDTEEIVITMNRDMNITANFLQFTHQLFIPVVIKSN